MSIVSRREFVTGFGGLAMGAFISGCGKKEGGAKGKEGSKEVTAVEDLMREHGVLRRVLFVYSETAIRLRNKPASVMPDALQRAVSLFRAFGEEYHEKKLEEAYIFPAVMKAGSDAARYPEILITQHKRGREITDYVLAVTKGTNVPMRDQEPLAIALESLVRMYRPHAAREDTIVFPAWK